MRLQIAKCFLLLSSTLTGTALAQAVPGLFNAYPSPPLQAGNLQPELPEILFPSAPPQVALTTAPSAMAIPAGTRVLMVLKSPLHTTSGTAGSGVYLETLYPVMQGNKVVIPAHTFVEGVVEGNRRPGHLHRTSEFRFRFTNLVFSNNYVAPIQGVLQSIPGAPNVRTSDKEGNLQTVDQAEKVITPTAGSAVGGAIIGSEHRFGIGKFTGAGLGAALRFADDVRGVGAGDDQRRRAAGVDGHRGRHE